MCRAKWHCVRENSVLIGGEVDTGDGRDIEEFERQAIQLGLTPEQVVEHWGRAKQDVERDLRSPAFRQQVMESGSGTEKKRLEKL